MFKVYMTYPNWRLEDCRLLEVLSVADRERALVILPTAALDATQAPLGAKDGDFLAEGTQSGWIALSVVAVQFARLSASDAKRTVVA